MPWFDSPHVSNMAAQIPRGDLPAVEYRLRRHSTSRRVLPSTSAWHWGRGARRRQEELEHQRSRSQPDSRILRRCRHSRSGCAVCECHRGGAIECLPTRPCERGIERPSYDGLPRQPADNPQLRAQLERAKRPRCKQWRSESRARCSFGVHRRCRCVHARPDL